MIPPGNADIAGLYGPGSEAWRLNREAMLLLGAGPRALLMQIAHPLIAEGVDQHSTFRIDPWSRLAATTRSYLTIVYGSGPQARREIARLNRLHRSISGPARDPAAREATGADRYAARDPELNLWVHATLVDSTIVAFDRWIEPLSRASREQYYAETRPIGRAFGVPDELLPPDLAAFEAYVAWMRGPDGPVRVTPTARYLAEVILHPPLARVADLVVAPPAAPILGRVLSRLPSSSYDWMLWPALALLPPDLRTEFGVGWSPAREFVATCLLRSWQAWRPLLPATFRQFGIAIAADRRTDRRLDADR